MSSLMTSLFTFEGAQYSQSRESEADAFALDILRCHYGHVGGADAFFRQLAEHDDLSPLPLHYFSSHPELEKRIADLSALAAERGYPLGETREYRKPPVAAGPGR